jgi:hypothetical protein
MIQNQLESYFQTHGLGELIEKSKVRPKGVNEMVLDEPYRPELADLHSIHRLILEHKRLTVLEFGCGWSTLVMANALRTNRDRHADEVTNLRRNNPFELHVVDNEQRYLNIAKSRLPETDLPHVWFHHTEIEMVEFNSRIAIACAALPLINPDFIYLDGPDTFNVRGDIRGISTRHRDMMPMSCDILMFEHFLTPGTMILIDGRGANVRFLKANFQRHWRYEHLADVDQHLFTLDEAPLGRLNEAQMKFYAS